MPRNCSPPGQHCKLYIDYLSWLENLAYFSLIRAVLFFYSKSRPSLKRPRVAVSRGIPSFAYAPLFTVGQLGCQLSPINHDCGARNVTCLLGCQKQYDISNLLGSADPPKAALFLPLTPDLLITPNRFGILRTY